MFKLASSIIFKMTVYFTDTSLNGDQYKWYLVMEIVPQTNPIHQYDSSGMCNKLE